MRNVLITLGMLMVVGLFAVRDWIIITPAKADSPAPTFTKTTVLTPSEKIKDNGIITVDVATDNGIGHGYYLWDSRFDLCFFITSRGVLEIDCEKLTRNLH